MAHSGIPTDSSGTPLPASLTGFFLVSETELMDPNFRRTVVLLVSHNEDGAFGLVVNRPTELTLGDIAVEFAGLPAGRTAAFIGGPVEQHYLFTLRAEHDGFAQSRHASRPAPGIVFEPVFQAIESYLRSEWAELPATTRPPVCFYLGYAGWSPGQLENELAHKAWLVIPAVPEIVFHPNPAEGWNSALKAKGGLYEVIAKTGFKPSFN